MSYCALLCDTFTQISKCMIDEVVSKWITTGSPLKDTNAGKLTRTPVCCDVYHPLDDVTVGLFLDCLYGSEYAC